MEPEEFLKQFSKVHYFMRKKKTWAMKQSHNETLRTTKISGEVLLEDQERKEF